MIYGYHRTSTREQHLDRGIMEIEKFCKDTGLKLERIFTDQMTGRSFDRPRYTVLKEDVLRKDDILIVTELDRLGRNKKGILDELRYYSEEGIRVMILEIPTTLQDLSSMDNHLAKMILDTINHMLIEIYAAMAEAEMEKKTKRQKEGIEAKKARGEWGDYGRPRIQKPDNWDEIILEWKAGRITAVEAMKRTGIRKSTFYRMVKSDSVEKQIYY